MKYTGLEEYLSKAILLLKELCPDNELWRNEAGLSNIEGEKLSRACQRAQANKDHNFEQESKVVLYRRARYGASESFPFPPHWTFPVNLDEICKQMLLKTFADDEDKRMTEKRLHRDGLWRRSNVFGLGQLWLMHLDWVNFGLMLLMDCG